MTRRAAYLHFASRTEPVGALFDYTAEAEGLEASPTPRLERTGRRRRPRRAGPATSPATTPEPWRWTAPSSACAMPTPDAAAQRKRVVAAKLASCQRLAGRLGEEGRPAPPRNVDSAAGMLFALISSDTIEALIADRR